MNLYESRVARAFDLRLGQMMRFTRYVMETMLYLSSLSVSRPLNWRRIGGLASHSIAAVSVVISFALLFGMIFRA
jgi:hypothetical protein